MLGSGSTQRDRNNDEWDTKDETICPLDYAKAGMLVDDEIYDALVKPLPMGCRLTALMDCCHSGTGMDLPYIKQAKVGPDQEACCTPCPDCGMHDSITGGRPGPVLVCDTPQPPPPPPRVLTDSGLGTWRQRRPPFFPPGANGAPFSSVSARFRKTRRYTNVVCCPDMLTANVSPRTRGPWRGMLPPTM